MCCIGTVYNSFELFVFQSSLYNTFTIHTKCRLLDLLNSALFFPMPTSERGKKINQETKCLKFHRNKAGYLMLTENPENKPFLILTQSFNETKTGF